MRGQKKACGESRDSFICEIKQIDMLMRTWEAVAVSPVVLAYRQTVWEDMDTRNKTTTIKINKKITRAPAHMAVTSRAPRWQPLLSTERRGTLWSNDSSRAGSLDSSPG